MENCHSRSAICFPYTWCNYGSKFRDCGFTLCRSFPGVFNAVLLLNGYVQDFSFELGNDEFRWRWDTYPLGAKAAADVLSRQLIMPLISVTHLAFSSADPVSELSEADLEKVGNIRVSVERF